MVGVGVELPVILIGTALTARPALPSLVLAIGLIAVFETPGLDRSSWWPILVAGTLGVGENMLAVLGVNLLGAGLRDLLDPRCREAK